MVAPFLGIIGGVFLVLFAIPLLLAPRRWARVLQWPEVERATPLTDYFGRCLGAVGVALTVGMLMHASDPAAHPVLLELMAVGGFLLLAVHVRGAIAKDQPWTENVEIGLYLLVTIAALALRLGWIE